MKKTILFILFSSSILALNAQSSGTNTFNFLELKLSPYIAALQGATITQLTDNPIAASRNPALFDSGMINRANLSYNNYLSDINFGTAAYAFNLKKRSYNAGLQYINYGKFDGYDIAGNPTGNFTADDYSFYIGTTEKLTDRLTAGANFKLIYSQLHTNFASGVGLDLGLHYRDSSGNTNLGFVIRNAGFMLKNYTKGVSESLPLRIELGFSKRLEHTPFRFNLLAHNLQKPNFRYVPDNGTNNATNLDGTSTAAKIGIGDNVLRHLTFGTELLLSDYTHLRFGYSHNMRRELAPSARQGLTGFSWGFGIQLYKIHFNYASSSFFPGINTNQFSAVFNLGALYKKKPAKTEDDKTN